MKTILHLRLAILGALLAGGAPSRAEEAKKEAAPDDPALAGEVVRERSEFEGIVDAEHHKRRTAHFVLETSLDADACRELIVFCEKSYRDFLEWAGLPPEKALWTARAQVLVIDRKTEWESLIRHRHRGDPGYVREESYTSGRGWDASPPFVALYSHEGSDRRHEELELFHLLNHFFLHGLAGSSKDGIVWWLWEGFSSHREAEILQTIGHGCAIFETGPDREGERIWFDRDDWVFFLKRDVRAERDEKIEQFREKDFRRIPQWNRAKAWSLVRYLVRDEGEKAKFVRFVSMLKTANDQAKALKECYGIAPEELDAAWREWILGQPDRWRKQRP